MKLNKTLGLTGLIILFIFSCKLIENITNSIASNSIESNTSSENDFGISGYYSPAEYVSEPSKRECYEGELSEQTKMNVLELVNYIRNLHGINPVIYAYDQDVKVQKGALIMAANRSINHYPPEDWDCWSEEGYQSSNNSNIIGGVVATFTPANSIVSFLIDLDVPSVGHRKWILNPFMNSIAYGHVELDGVTGALLQVLNEDEQNTDVDFVAYPFNEYPAVFFDMNWRLSFIAIQNRETMINNLGIDYSSAVITVIAENGKSLDVSSVLSENGEMGILNMMSWEVDDLEYGVKYDVTITGVKTDKGLTNYEYWFRIE